jgi:6-phosphogluconolactonase (cycloisomerase 2 family)
MWNRIAPKQSSTPFTINPDDDALSQQQPLLSSSYDEDLSLEAPYVRSYNPLPFLYLSARTHSALSLFSIRPAVFRLGHIPCQTAI